MEKGLEIQLVDQHSLTNAKLRIRSPSQKKGGGGVKTGYSGSHNNSNSQRLRIAVSRHSKGDFPDSSFMRVKPHSGFEMNLCLCDVLMCGTRDLSQGL